MTTIVQKDAPVLRKTAKEVVVADIASARIKNILVEMMTVLDKCPDGVALAAPQLGYSLRIFIVSPKTFAFQRSIEVSEQKNDLKEADKLIYINPVITRRSSKKVILDEGCLSVKGTFGKIKRHEKVSIAAYDEFGKKFVRGASGLLAEIYQHETDHLDGILFTDTAKNLVQVEKKDAPKQ